MHLLVFMWAVAAPKPATQHARAVEAFKRADYRRAADLLSQDLLNQEGTTLERETREMLVLARYNANQHEDARLAFRALLRKFPDFHFNEDEVLPEVIAFFEVERPPPAPATEPIVVAPAASAPAVIKEAPPPPHMVVKKPWRAYYLVPLGIGQYLAGSPVRGTIFLLAQLGFIALNVVGAVLYGQQLYPDGNARSLTQAQQWQIVTNVGFGGIVGAVALGAIDGIFLEP